MIASNQYGRYTIPESSAYRPAAQAVIRGEVWEPDTIALMCASCGDGDIVHAGTYFGDFLPALSQAVAPGALVHAFEPCQENHRAAFETMAMNGLENVALERTALSSVSGTARMRTHGAGRSLGGISKLDPDGDVVVPLTTIDEVVGDRRVSVVQLDVEGHEREALMGGFRTIERDRPLLILEEWVEDQWDRDEWFASAILPMGYTRRRNVHENAVYAVEET